MRLACSEMFCWTPSLEQELRRTQDRGKRVAQLVREHRQELLAAAHALLQLGFRRTPLGDIEERHHGADHLVVAHDRVAPVLRRERGAVRAPEHFAVDVRRLAVAHRVEDRRLLRRIRRAVRPGVMNRADASACRSAPPASRSRAVRAQAAVTKDADARRVDAVDRLCRRIEQQADTPLALGDVLARADQLA